MSFHLTSRDISFSSPAQLRASCRGRDGTYHPATLDLDRCLGNDDGAFTWGGHNFSHSARNVQLLFPLLTAELRDCDGHWHDAEVDLSQRLENINGALRFEWGGAVGSVLDEVAYDFHRGFLDPLERTVSDLFGFGGGEAERATPRPQEPAPETARGPSTSREAGPASASGSGPARTSDPHELFDANTQSLDGLSRADLGERLLAYLLRAPDCARPFDSGHGILARRTPNGDYVLDFSGGTQRVERTLSREREAAMRAEQAQQRVVFDADEHVDRGIKMEDGEANAKKADEAAHELEGQKKKEGAEKDDEATQLRREVESVDTESRLDTPDFSDAEDEWLVAK